MSCRQKRGALHRVRPAGFICPGAGAL